jgi:DNA-binding MarR family transcriptional regulator
MTPDAAHLPCAAGTLRRASRSLARLYDSHLAHAGLTTTQFSILRTLQRHGGRAPLAGLADELVFERTSLYRALAPLGRAKLIAFHAGADKRSRHVVLTAKGTRVIAAALPRWAAAQRAVVNEFGAGAWHDLAGKLVDMTAIARAADAR